MDRYDGWIARHKSGRILAWSFGLTRTDVIHRRIGLNLWQAWKRKGYKLVKVKLIEVE